jgi:hypothetical protein
MDQEGPPYSDSDRMYEYYRMTSASATLRTYRPMKPERNGRSTGVSILVGG